MSLCAPYCHSEHIGLAAMRCQVLSQAMLLRLGCATCSTDIGYAATRLYRRHERCLRQTPVSYTHLRAHETEADL
eukprot:924839-Rhodomonas_salina.1